MATDQRTVVHGAFESRAQTEKAVQESRWVAIGERRSKRELDGSGAAERATGAEGTGGGETRTGRGAFADCFTGGVVGGVAGVVVTGLMPGVGPESAAVLLAACTAVG